LQNNQYRGTWAEIVKSDLQFEARTRALIPPNGRFGNASGDTTTFKTIIYHIWILFLFSGKKKIISVILCNLLQRKRYKGENKRSDCQIKVIERVRRNGLRIVQPVVVFLDKKREEGGETRERILNGYLLRSVDCTSERSGFNHEKGKQMLFYVTLQSRAADRIRSER